MLEEDGGSREYRRLDGADGAGVVKGERKIGDPSEGPLVKNKPYPCVCGLCFRLYKGSGSGS